VILLASYVAGCFVFTLFSRAVHTNLFARIHPFLAVGADLQYLVVAFLMTFFVWWSGAPDEIGSQA